MGSAGIKVATATHRIEADLILLHLKAAGVHPWLVDDAILGAEPMLSAAIGGYKIHVDAAEHDAAVEAMKAYRRPHLVKDGDSCLSCGAAMSDDDVKCKACGWSYES